VRKKQVSTVQAVAPTPEPYVQQTHRDCGGIIVAVARSGEAALACRTCKVVWQITLPFMGGRLTSTIPDDWSGDWTNAEPEGGAK
jgi:hypothetical protein